MEYYINSESGVWLYPLLEVLGLALQILTLIWKSPLLLFCGFFLVALAAIPERDITLLVSDLLAVSGLYVIFFYKK